PVRAAAHDDRHRRARAHALVGSRKGAEYRRRLCARNQRRLGFAHKPAKPIPRMKISGAPAQPFSAIRRRSLVEAGARSATPARTLDEAQFLGIGEAELTPAV